MGYRANLAARRTTSASLLFAVLTASAVSHAQPEQPPEKPPPEEPNTGSVPTGGAGAVIVEEAGAAITDAAGRLCNLSIDTFSHMLMTASGP